MELSAFSNISLNLDVSCFSENWLIDEQMKTLNAEQYKLADKFSGVKCNYGGTCIFVGRIYSERKLNILKICAVKMNLKCRQQN